MRLYLDTEFTDLKPGAKLISIALVDENENFFYAELTDTWTYEDCSPFVHNYVLPYLFGYRKPEYQMTWAECALKIGNWIEDREEQCVIACDNIDWDSPYLNSLISAFPPENLVKNIFVPVTYGGAIVTKIVAKHSYTVHNSLHDALIMKKSTCNTSDYL